MEASWGSWHRPGALLGERKNPTRSPRTRYPPKKKPRAGTGNGNLANLILIQEGFALHSKKLTRGGHQDSEKARGLPGFNKHSRHLQG